MERLKNHTACPLCGEPVSWAERQAGLYACLTVCVPLVPFPKHLVEKHSDYLAEAKKAARPVFYTAVVSAAAAAGLFLTGVLAAAWFAAASATAAFLLGFRRRKNLLRRFCQAFFDV
ncbi:MAG: hypothetical protein QXR26_07755 [Candidatus Caldarchaeum sp.]